MKTTLIISKLNPITNNVKNITIIHLCIPGLSLLLAQKPKNPP